MADTASIRPAVPRMPRTTGFYVVKRGYIPQNPACRVRRVQRGLTWSDGVCLKKKKDIRILVYLSRLRRRATRITYNMTQHYTMELFLERFIRYTPYTNFLLPRT